MLVLSLKKGDGTVTFDVRATVWMSYFISLYPFDSWRVAATARSLKIQKTRT